MKPAIRDALDRLMLEVQSDRGQQDIILIESYLFGEEDFLRKTKRDIESLRDELKTLQLELDHASEYA